MLIDDSIHSFLEHLGSPEPVPGGGSASALAGALSARLLRMVVTLTQEREEDKREALAPVLARVTAAADALAACVDRDAEAYARVRRAYAMPKDAEDLRIKRAMEIQLALREATSVPLEVAEHCLEALEAASDVALHGRVSCISDAGTGNFLALAAAMGALLNVQVNIEQIDDEAYVASVMERASSLAEHCQAGFERARERIAERMAAG